MPPIVTSTVLPGFMEPTPTDVPQQITSPGCNVMSWEIMLTILAGGITISLVNRPVWLVLVASALAYFVAPVIFFLNLYYCFTVIPKADRLFYPSRFATVFGWLSFIMFTGMTAVLIWDRLL